MHSHWDEFVKEKDVVQAVEASAPAKKGPLWTLFLCISIKYIHVHQIFSYFLLIIVMIEAENILLKRK